MEISLIIPHIEALIFASEKPLTTLDLVELVNKALAFMEDRATLDQVEAAVDAIREKYAAEFYPFEVRESGGGWQFLTKASYHKTVAVLNGEKFLKRLSTAALETLAIIAYKQPITKSEIESIRGVNSDYAVQKLLEKELIVIAGRKEDAPGHPLVYATSRAFMDYFGINSPDELPKLSDIVPTDMVQPTTINQAHLVDSDIADTAEPAEPTLAVNAEGQMELLQPIEEAKAAEEVDFEEPPPTDTLTNEAARTAEKPTAEAEATDSADNQPGNDQANHPDDDQPRPAETA
jgi:segregation and condensation protein B